jgi:hypothetical protein
VWARPESCTNHVVEGTQQAITPYQAPFWQFQTGPYGGRHCFYWSAAYTTIGPRTSWGLISTNTGVVTVSNTSPIARRVQVDVTYPRIQDYVTLQSPWCELVGEAFYNIYPTGGPVGPYVGLYGSQIDHVPFAYAPDDALNDVGQPFYPYANPYGSTSATGLGSGWITGSAYPGVGIDGGGNGLVAAITELGTVGYHVIIQPGESVRATFQLNAVTGLPTPYQPLGPDLPWRASYTSLLNFGFTKLTLL